MSAAMRRLSRWVRPSGAVVIVSRFAVGLGAAGLLAVAGVVAAGMLSSGGSQPAQLTTTPAPTIELMPMGNAHIPTTDACLLCHGAAGEIKTVPAILHPIEGWRRCTVCHTDETLGRTAPGHVGIAEAECLNCHKVAEAGPAITQPHAQLQDQHCLDCHGGVAHLPSSMASTKESDCILCHKPTPLPPPQYPHAADARLACSECHRSPEVGNLPIDHANRTDDECLLCHDIKIGNVITGPGQSALPSPGESWEPSLDVSPSFPLTP
jgi:hypothetical protein